MKRFLFLAALAATLLQGCRNAPAGPSALDVIMTRTSVRAFTGEPVSDAQIETILRAGMAAPTAVNYQPWRFIVLRDREVIESLYGNGWGRDMYLGAGAIIVVCGKTTWERRPFGQPDAPAETTPNPFWYEDCSAAAENILLAAHALGLGAVWTAGYPAMDRVNGLIETLGIPGDVLPLCVIPVGVPAENPEPKDKWNPENIHWDKW